MAIRVQAETLTALSEGRWPTDDPGDDPGNGPGLGPGYGSGVDPGEWLVSQRAAMDRGEARWLLALGEFDASGAWALDGQLSCVQWLVLRTHMARATAFEKLRIARALRRRDLLSDAFVAGRVSYSAVRAITRMTDPDPEVDAAVVELARCASVADVERAVRHYELNADQHRAARDLCSRRSLHITSNFDGTTHLEATLSAIEGEELAAALARFMDRDQHQVGGSEPPSWSDLYQSPAEDSPEPGWSEATTATGCSPVPPEPSWSQRRVDALMDMVRVGVAHADDDHSAAPERYLVHLVVAQDQTTLGDGTELDFVDAQQAACGSPAVVHVLGASGETLRLGRKTRIWSLSQRRAAWLRDRGHCRFPGCEHRVADLHHQRPWSEGGSTDLDNAYLVCRRHHRLLHDGFYVTGDPNGALCFYRPDHFLIGTTAARFFEGSSSRLSQPMPSAP